MDFLIEAAKVFVLLFAVIDPFGNVPLFLAMTPGDSDAGRRQMAARASIVAFIVLAVFALFGRFILAFFSLDVAAFQVAGGIVLAAFALPMLSATRLGARIRKEEETEGAEKADVSIVPLAIPLIAGPGAITAVIVLTQSSKASASPYLVIACAGAAILVCFIILALAGKIAKLLGDTGLNVLTRIMGLITLVLAVQFVLSGARAFFAAA